jgi:hypothetical protein
LLQRQYYRQRASAGYQASRAQNERAGGKGGNNRAYVHACDKYAVDHSDQRANSNGHDYPEKTRIQQERELGNQNARDRYDTRC